MSNCKKPSIAYWLGNNLYLNITNKCSNNCIFCLRKFRDGVGGFNLKLENDPSATEVISELQKVINKKNWNEIVFCGFGEPTMRLDCILEVTQWIRKYYGKIMRLRIDTNGHGFLLNEGRDILKELKDAGVDMISVSLNAHDEKLYNQICRPMLNNAFKSVLEFIRKAKKEFDIETTAVAIPEIDISKVRDLAQKLGVNFRVRDYIPCFS
ncbi:MAG: TatD family nuclease-associated radical SAM protein [Candidatus Bathyarchaeia archaeon]